ncbi:hypothetical protein HYH02_003412 [Chlamydomonas schloesseri]|uniref:Uncharacterized protein n=1 Tax=Chlamydomonas schloesseri TaxID=2026947 RepID=A0A835WPR2_9CHLO|nr:hypothetical protein HYH02_003412 [Chlamydomonas schloesseri]|eukprot:KAG2451632.1 hypothetical protein HYH02_003412 [Chlamydomonas schloesseri]
MEELSLQLHTDEGVWMRQVGHLKDWCQGTQMIKLGVPARVTTALAADSIRLLFLFKNLQRLDLTLNSPRIRLEQPLLVACAELLGLTSLSISGGHLSHKGLDLGVLTSLRKLNALAVRPHSDEGLDGLEDEHLATAARLTGLKSLSLRASENVTDEGVGALTTLTGLTQLTLVPLGLEVSRDGIMTLAAAMPGLQSLSVGLHESRQVAALKGLPERSTDPLRISMVLNAPETSASSFFSTLTLVLRPSLVSLRMGTLESTDSAFLLAVGTLSQLTELKMGVSLAEGGRPFTCNLGALSGLGHLRTLEFAVTKDLGLPLSVKQISMLALAWPSLTSLSLSVMGKAEVAPEALGLLDNFSRLSSLSLFAPLDYSVEEEMEAITLPVHPHYLPRGLKSLVLECAHVRCPAAPAGSNGRGASASGGSSGTGASAAESGDGEAGSSTARASRELQRQGTGGTGRALASLEQLELNSCSASDEALTAILGSATGLRHLELTDVASISDTGLGALRGLTRLEHLVVRMSSSAPPPPPAAAGRGGRTSTSDTAATFSLKAPVPKVTHASLGALRTASTLRHLEWSLGEPLTEAELGPAMAAISGLGNLQHVALDVVPELRISREGMRGSGAGAGGAQGSSAKSLTEARKAAGSEDSDSNDEDEEDEATAESWHEQLESVLPLVYVTDRPGVVLYSLWEDATLNLSSR